jgi:flagellar basal-body rod protein FlgC
MGFLSSIDISGSALTAQRLRMDVISENIANAETAQTDSGEPYRRKVCVISERSSFSSALNDAVGKGVVVSGIVEDASDFEMEYDPASPLADEDGYVRMPNVDEVEEIIDLMEATRSYQANVTALNATKNMAIKALEIGK